MIRLILVLLFAFVHLPGPKEIKWVAIGDSITYLNDHTDETGDRITTGYMTLVTKKLPNVHYVNKGFNGWTSGNIAKNIDSLGLQEADVYSVFLGTNDWWQGRAIGTLDDFLNNTGNGTINGSFRIIIDKLRELNARAKIILITPMQRGDFVYIGDMKNNAYGSYRDKNGQSLAQVVDAIEKIGQHEKLSVVDLFNDSGITLKKMVIYKRLKDPVTGEYKQYKYPFYTTIPFNPETDEYPYPVDAIDMTYDGLHPSDKGFKIIASMIEKFMK
ncbi:MAG: SGNH/GDSL hydrolase family protein [Chryseolinea sp.]